VLPSLGYLTLWVPVTDEYRAMTQCLKEKVKLLLKYDISATVTLRKQPPVSTVLEAGWTPEPIWTIQGQISCPYQELNPDSLVV
jgi:hypothetical protein